MAIYTELFAEGVHAAVVAPLAVYTAPMDGVIVLRDIILVTEAAGSIATLGVIVNTPGGGSVWIEVRTSVPALTPIHWQGRQVIAPGAELRVYGTGGTFHYRLTGYHLGV